MPLVAACLPLAHGQQPGFLGKSSAKWVEELGSRDPKVRRSAAFALGKSNSDAIHAVPKLVRALKDKAPGVREAAAFALGEIGPTPWEETYGGLVAILGDSEPDAHVRRSAACALGKLGRLALPGEEESAKNVWLALEKSLTDADAAVRQNGAWALGRIGPKKGHDPVPALVKALADTDPLVRRDAANALSEFGGAGRAATTILLARFKEDRDETVRKAALNALVNVVGQEDHAAVADLREALHHADAEIVKSAALALANIGGAEAAPAVPVLCGLLLDKDAGARRLAAAALAHIGPHAAAGVPALAKALTDRDPLVRRNAALALSRIGPKAEPAVPELAKLLGSKEDPEEVRTYAAEALSKISPAIQPAIPTLLRILKKDQNWGVRQRAVWALARLEDPGQAGIPAALALVLDETDNDTRLVRYDSAIVLGILLGDKVSDRAIDILQALLHDKEIMVYKGADAKVSSSGAETRSGETTVTKDISGDSRGLAATALGRIGPRANRPEIIRGLQEATKSADPKVREAATDALKKIQ